MYRESEKNLELEKKILELKAELRHEQEKAEILSKMLEHAKNNAAIPTTPTDETSIKE
jgi:hypothetical protein